jgi:hypothetical protein
MISFLIDSKIRKYDLLIIQKLWRNVCVSTSYNSFNIDFHLLYQKSKDVRTCFYVNFRLNANHWSIIFASKNVCFFRIRTTNDRWINVHNVYSDSSNSYASISTLLVIETIKRQLNDEKKHIVLKNFNLHHSLWSDLAKSTQHDATNQLLDVVHQTQLRFTLSSNTITWKTRNSCSIINLIFMFEKLQKKLVHFMIKSKFNQSSDHISISIKIMLEMNLKIERQRRTWKKIDIEKLINFWRDFVASTSFNSRQHVEKYAIRIRQSIKSAMNIAMSWNKSFIETKLFWNDRCVDAMTTIKRKRRKWTTTHSTNVWRNYLRVSNEKKKIINKKKKMKFRRVFRIICDISSKLWRLVRWTKSKNHRFREISKIFDLIRRDQNDNVLECVNDFDIKIRFLIELFFFDTTNANLNDISTYSYSSAVDETSALINENEIKRAIKWCKSNSASKSNDISNRVLKILVNKLISHLLNLFRVCVELNYHSLCFRKTHIITLKKSKKKNYTNIKTYKSIVLLNTLDKALKSIIAQRINDLTKTHNLLSINQINERKNRSCETTLKLFIEQIHTVWNMSKDKVITLLNMNVVEAYDHVSKAKLLHNLWEKRILIWIIVWTNNFMQNRRIIFVINSDTTTMSNVNVDISQSSFVFFILYLFYNADLLKLLKRSFRRIATLNFVNDINILTYESSITSNCRILKEMHAHCETWTRRHEVVFASIKYELIHLTRNSKKFDIQTIVRICDVVKQSSNQIRVLRVQIDIKLKWRTHVKSIQKKMIIQTLTLSRFIVFIWEACFVKTRLIYKTIIKSAVIYASIFWHASHDRSNNVVDTTTKFIKMSQQCLKMINDNFKAMSTQILEIEIFVEFIQLHLIHLQIKFRQRIKKKQHDAFVFNFCNKIKNRLTT